MHRESLIDSIVVVSKSGQVLCQSNPLIASSECSEGSQQLSYMSVPSITGSHQLSYMSVPSITWLRGLLKMAWLLAF